MFKDSWDAETAGLIIKKEAEDFKNFEDQCSSNYGQLRKECVFESIKIKTEIKSEVDEFQEVSKMNLKREIELSYDDSSIDMEFQDVTGMELKRELAQIEPSYTKSHNDREESYLDDMDDKIKNEILNTPNKMEIKRDVVSEDSNPSPFNKELFKNFNLGQGYGSPEQGSKHESRKSVKRSVFTRLSPYKKYIPEETSPYRQSVKKRLGARISPELPR